MTSSDGPKMTTPFPGRVSVAPLSRALRGHLATRQDADGRSLLRLSFEQPCLVVFLRHFGCTFCRETLADLAEDRRTLESQGIRIVLVHMSPDDTAREFFARYGLDDVPRIADPQRALYRAFGLARGSLRQLFGPRVWWRGLKAGLLSGHGVGRLQGDGFQMPGAFLLHRGEVQAAYLHVDASDRPDYCRLADAASSHPARAAS
jgi:hypothetical protein